MERANDFKVANPEIVDIVESVELIRISDFDLALIGGGCGEVIFPHSN